MKKSFPLIETARLQLRMLTPDDAESLYSIWSDPEVMKFIPIVIFRTREEVKQFIPMALERWEERSFGIFAVTLKETGQMMGYCGLQYLDETPEVEIYYGFLKDFWGKGFATEAAQAVLRFAFEEKKIENVAGITHLDNAASQKVLVKIGLKKHEENRKFYDTECTYFTIARENYTPGEAFYRLSYD
jgi:ribosomal-protein-alanine N-acetyltransferase